MALYGAMDHMWEVDSGDLLLLGRLELVMPFTKDEAGEKLTFFSSSGAIRKFNDGGFWWLWRNIWLEYLIGAMGED